MIALSRDQETLLTEVRAACAEGVRVNAENTPAARVLASHELIEVKGPYSAERLVITQIGASYLCRTTA